MSHWFSWLLLVLSFGSAPCFGDEPPREQVILCLGDSITKGVRPGVAATDTFASRLEALLKAKGETVRVINVGIGGEQTDQALARLGKVLNEHHPDLVTVMYGTNDSYVDKGTTGERISPWRFRANLAALIDRIRRAGAAPILMTEPRYAERSGPNGIGEHCNIRLERFVAITREVARDEGTPLVDHFAGWSEAVRGGRDLWDWTTDGYHPNSAGHQEMADRIAAVLAAAPAKEEAVWLSRSAPRELLSWPELSVPGAKTYRQPGAVYFVFRDAPATSITIPRLDNVVLRARWFPIAATTADESMGIPFVPDVAALLPFRQSPTTWTIAIDKPIPAPCVVALEVAGTPQLAPEGAVSRPGRDGVVVLPAHHAQVHGEKLQFEPLTHKNTVGYWVNPNDWAEWKVDAPAGEYELKIFQGCGGHAGSDVVVQIGDKELPFQVDETGHFQNFRWRSIGRVTLEGTGAQSLELRCRKLAKGAVMDVRQIRLVPTTAQAAPANVWDSAPDVLLPPLTREAPAAGRRSLLTLEGEPAAYHAAYFPTNWNPGRKWPVLVEWTGNGPYSNDLGDRSTGRLEDGELAIGLAGTDSVICLSLPYLDDAGKPVTQWWGTPPEHRPERTLAYARRAVAELCDKFGGDRDRLVLTGFSRGAIAAHALGLHDDETARLWRSFVCFSHYDGVRTWPFAGSDRATALTRLKRLGDRPEFLLSESTQVAGASLQAVRDYLAGSGQPLGRIELAETGFVNHDDAWALRPSPARERVRAWLETLWR